MAEVAFVAPCVRLSVRQHRPRVREPIHAQDAASVIIVLAPACEPIHIGDPLHAAACELEQSARTIELLARLHRADLLVRVVSRATLSDVRVQPEQPARTDLPDQGVVVGKRGARGRCG